MCRVDLEGAHSSTTRRDLELTRDLGHGLCEADGSAGSVGIGGSAVSERTWWLARLLNASMSSNRTVRNCERVSCSHGPQMLRTSRLIAAQP